MSCRHILVLLLLTADRPVLAQAALSAADRGSAGTLFEALASDPFADEPFAALARIYERGPGRAELLKECKRRAALEPGSPVWPIILARVALEAGQRDEAIRQLTGAVKRTRNPRTLRRLARLLDESNAVDAAVAAYQAGLAEASPEEERRCRLRMGSLLLAKGKTKPALEMWAAVVRSQPQNASVRQQIADALAARGLSAEALAALKELESVLAQNPRAQIPVIRREAEIEDQRGDGLGATRSTMRAFSLAASAGDEVLEAELAMEFLKRTGKHPSSQIKTLLRHAAVADPSVVALEAELALAQSDRKSAILLFKQVNEARPNDRYVLRRRAALESAEERRHTLEALFSLDRNDAALGFDLIRAHLDSHHPDDATRVARVMRERFGDNATLLQELTQLLAQNRQHTEALATAERLIALDPDRPDALTLYGDELLAAGRGAEAETSYFRLVSRSKSLDSYRHLIEVLARRGLSSSLKRAYTDALDHWPDNPELRRDFASWLGRAGQLDEAIHEWKMLREKTTTPLLLDYANREIKRLEDARLLQGK